MKNMMRWILLSLLLIWQGGICFAQNSGSGDIRGTATDQTGALVAGATVTVLNVDTGVSLTVTTNSAGLYDTTSIVLGNYKLTFFKDGFEQFVRGPVTVQAGYTTVNAQLKVGSTTEEVVVNTDVPLLTTETQEQSTTLEAKTLEQLPQVGQNWESFTAFMPGATGTASGNSNGATTANPGQALAVNGNMAYANYTLNGSTILNVNSSNAVTPVMETISEVKIGTSTFSAQSGIGGIQYDQISKGGTSQFHGAIYEYFQNDALNAKNYGFGNPVKVPILRYNNYGGAIGGPILKNKLFFYFNFDRTHQLLSDAHANTGFVTVPTAAELSGDFTGFPTIYDPTTQVVHPTGTFTQPDGTVQTCPCVSRTSFAAEYGNGNKIPAALISPVAKNIAALFPTQTSHPSYTQFVPGTLQPNGVLQNNYSFSIPAVTTVPKYFGRLDYDLSSKHRITISADQQDVPAFQPGVFSCPVGCETSDVDSKSAQVSDVWTISPRTINEARFGFVAQLVFFSDATLGKGYPQKLGLQFAKSDVMPNLNIANYSAPGAGTNAILKEFGYDPSDVVTLIRGRHILHFGGEFLMYQNNATQWGNIHSGDFTFSGAYTQAYVGNAATGVGFADFLLGDSSKWGASFTPEYGARYKSPQMFVQDDYKLKPNLTVNLGLRYVIQKGWNEVNGNMSSFDPTILNPATNTLGAMWYGTTKANGRSAMQATIWSSVLPRLGFAWQPASNMTVRGGFGIYDFNYTIGTKGVGMGGVTLSTGSVTDLTNGITPAVNLFSSGSNLPYAVQSRADPAALNGQGAHYQMYHAPDDKIDQWNLAVQRELGPTMVAEIAYVGSHGYNLPFPSDINQVPVANLGPNDNPSGRPYPQFQGIFSEGANFQAVSNYNALQATISKRLTSGLSFNVNYTWSHFLDNIDTSGWFNGNSGTADYQNAHDPSANYGASNFDIRNAFKGSVTYQLPVGLGRRYLNGGGSANRLLDGVIGGWNIAGLVRVQSGTPFTPIITINNSYSQAGQWYPNVIGDPHLSNPSIATGWFNPAAYASPLNGTFGNAHRNSLYGPGYNRVDLSLGKTFSIRENIKFELRGDAVNAFNHPSFGDPNAVLNCPTPGAACSAVTNDTNLTVGGRTMQLGARVSF